jgi:hypothetical protein
MIFLIEYDRAKGEIVTISEFHDSQRTQAEESRLQVELDLNHSRVDHEVVLLDAANEEALRLTHRRYFEDLLQLLEGQTKSQANGK